MSPRFGAGFLLPDDVVEAVIPTKIGEYLYAFAGRDMVSDRGCGAIIAMISWDKSDLPNRRTGRMRTLLLSLAVCPCGVPRDMT